MSEEKIFAKKCGYCHEIMPLSEKICYCDGPVKIVKLDKIKRASIEEYFHRKAMFKMRGTIEGQ